MNFKSLLPIALCGLLTNCIKVIDLPLPDYEKKAVLNGFLNPDSLIKLRLTYSLPPNDTTQNYPAITDAQVVCIENGKQIGVLSHTSKGYYQLNQRPKIGASYQVKAQIPNYGEVTAQDRVPEIPKASISVGKPNPDNLNGNPDFTLSLTEMKNTDVVYWMNMWLGTTVRVGDNIYKAISTDAYILTNSFLIDGFTGKNNSLSSKKAYEFYIRLEPNLVLKDKEQIIFTTYNQTSFVLQNGGIVNINFYAFSPQVDKLVKSTVVAFQNRYTKSNGDINNPFAAVIPIYSNVENGLGMWGAYQLVTFELKK